MGRKRGRQFTRAVVAKPLDSAVGRSGEMNSPPEQTVDQVRGELRSQRQVLQFESYRSDTLPPRVIEEMIRVLPDSGPVFIEEMKAQGAHRRQMERDASKASERRFDRGQIGAFAVAIAALVCGTTAIVSSNGSTGAFVFASVVAALGIGGPPVARIFIERSRKRQDAANERPSSAAESV
jgi:hypothetical protein